MIKTNRIPSSLSNSQNFWESLLEWKPVDADRHARVLEAVVDLLMDMPNELISGALLDMEVFYYHPFYVVTLQQSEESAMADYAHIFLEKGIVLLEPRGANGSGALGLYFSQFVLNADFPQTYTTPMAQKLYTERCKKTFGQGLIGLLN